MTHQFKATYFDGLSSASQQISVGLNETVTELHLQTKDGDLLVWGLDHVQCEQYGSLLEIRNKNVSDALLKTDNKAFIEKFYSALKQHKGIDIHTRLLGLGFPKIIAIAVCFLSLIVLSYFYVLPPIAERSAAYIPDRFDQEIGNIFMDTFLSDNDIDTLKTSYLEQFAAELNLNQTKKLRFSVVKSKQINAFALPNGQIVVFTGILDHMRSADELVALLGHEASHINQRHTTKMLCRNLAGYLGVSLLLSDVNGIMSVLADNAQQLHSLSFSRKFEQEADEQGLKIVMENQINPKGMMELFERLETENKISIPKIMSTHPLTKERKKHIQKIISETNYEVIPNNKLDSIFKNIKQQTI